MKKDEGLYLRGEGGPVIIQLWTRGRFKEEEEVYIEGREVEG